MTSARERLAQLATADFDSFGEQDVAGGTVDTPLTPDEWVAIRDEIKERKWDDHALIPELLTEALRVLGEIGTGNSPDPARTATQALRGMAYRAHVGAWRHEVEAEPAWSLDSERELPLIRKVETVVRDL